MGKPRNLSLAIAAALSMSAITGCSSIGSSRIKAIPDQASASSPTIVHEKVAYLSATRSRAPQTSYAPPQQQAATHNHPAYQQSNGDVDLLYAAQVLLNQPAARPQTRTVARPQTISYPAPQAARKVYRAPKKAQPQTYRVASNQSILDDPAYRQVLLQLAGMAPDPVQQAYQAPAPKQVQRPTPARAAPSKNQPQVASSNMFDVPGEDMWDHVKNGYGMGNHGNRRVVQHFARVYGQKPERLQRIANRATGYLHIVVTELKRRGMPTELALLPFVESAYVNTAFSHAGAAGMWQFIPSTGRMYGLKQNKGFDGRMDTLESTRAALDYLQKLHRQFNGDWFLALAAYNAGEGRVSRAIKYNRARGRKTDYWSIKLPRETREYVPRLLAYKEIIARPASYGFRLNKTPNMPKLVEIHVNKPVNLRKAAMHAGLQADTLTDLNPNFLKGVTTPRVSKRILLPRNQAGRLAHVIHQLPAERPVSISRTRVAKASKKRTKRYSKKRSKARTYRVKRGETIYKIAMRHGMTVNKLKRLNGLRSSRINAGARLKVI